MNNTSISFIIPLYNEEHTILMCLEAIMGQMSSEDEIIVVDNGSSDGSLKRIQHIQNVLLIHKPDSTIGAVRNAGSEMAKGQILAFIDADCIICPRWRENVIKTFSNNEIGATGSKVDIPDDAVWIEKAWYSQRDSKSYSASYINSGNLIVKKDVYEEVGGFLESLITGEDSELGWRINKAGFAILNNPEIRAIHMGNPKKLRNFYNKEKWHALGMLGTFKISCYDKPLIMTILFAVCNISAMITLLNMIKNGTVSHAVVLFILLTGCIPVVTAMYRVLQFRNVKYFMHLVILYWVYYLARTYVLYTIGIKAINNKQE